MAKPELGIKRRCTSCGVKFYDLSNTPIICPKCGTEIIPEILLKPKRQSIPVDKVKTPAPKATEKIEDESDDDDVLLDDDDDDEIVDIEDDDEMDVAETAEDVDDANTAPSQ